MQELMTGPDHTQETNSDSLLESLSHAVSLTVLELDANPQKLVPAFFLANLMSPALWDWRNEKRAVNEHGVVYSPRNRLNQIQRFFHRYTFTNLPDRPGGDPWGLISFDEEERRFGAEFVRRIRSEYDTTLRQLHVENPESQFGQIVNEPYYARGLFPRLKNETLEVMNAFATTNEEGKASGKCWGLAVALWAAALVVWGRFPLDQVVITGNRAHVFVYLDVEDGHLLNNTKWFSTTRINNRSKLSDFVRVVASGPETTFFYSPSVGMCHCISRTSQIPHHQVKDIYRRIGEFVSNPLKHPDPEQIRYIEPSHAVPDPLDHDSAESYQSAIHQLAREYPGSIFEYALYVFRSLRVRNPEVYIRAALREPNTTVLAAEVATLDDALSIVRGIEGNSSIFGSRDRIAMPDEVVYFDTGHEAEKSLLLYTLLRKSSLANLDSSLLLTKDHSLVMVNGRPVYPESCVSFELGENTVGTAPTTISLSATITCPKCGFVKAEQMPTNACVFFYECTNCLDLLKPLPGDCCVFCSYGSVQCPPKGAGNGCC
jgi:hypothetical protein